jgi:alpha-L-fucosidase 2
VIRTLEDCHVVWNAPGTSSLDSLPLGNGDVGVNLWVEKGGDLLFYVSKVDAFDGNGITFKLGRVRLALQPNPFLSGQRFRQELVLKDGLIRIEAESGHSCVRIRAWVDANRPVIRVSVESGVALDAVVSLDWSRSRMYACSISGAGNGKRPMPASGTVGLRFVAPEDGLAWAFRNVTSQWKKKLIAQKSSELAKKVHDPLLNLTSGCLVSGKGFVRDGVASLRLSGPRRRIDLSVHVLACQADSPAGWFSRIEKQAVAARTDEAAAFKAHSAWWRAFWKRSHIRVEACGKGRIHLDGYRFTQYRETTSDYFRGLGLDGKVNAFQITQRYALERFVQACANRGSVPSPFNGSIFTMDLPAGVHGFGKPRSKLAGADERDWGTLPFFWQNTRHPGWSMLARGDYDMMMPSFRLIRDSLDVSRDRARRWFGHAGAFMPEGIIAGGVAIFEEAPAHLRYHWLGTIEMTAMMCDYVEHTGDLEFAAKVLLPCADEFVRFYELHYPKRDRDRRMVIEPAGTVETYQPVTNPVTEVTGLRYLLAKLLSLDLSLTGARRRAYWRRVLAILPGVPWRRVMGLELLAPGARYSGRLICETPELYAVWPFRQTAIGSDDVSLARARQSFHVRQLSLDGTPDSQSWETGGWQPAPIWAACLGLPREAARLVSINFDDRLPNMADNAEMVPPEPGHPRARFPGFWETKMDYTPDSDHGAVSANALQSMLLQSDGRRIFLLPAWPEDWDVSFKLHAAFNTTVQCVYRGGRIRSLSVTPGSRRPDIVDLSSAEHRIRSLVRVACSDRNYLFGLPPMLDGRPKPGRTTEPWLKRYGECLQDVHAAPWSNSVFRGNILYVFDLDGGKPGIPPVPAVLVSSRIITDNGSSPVSVLKLEYDRPLDAFALAAVSAGSLTAGMKPDNRGQVELGKRVTFDRIEVVIENQDHVRGRAKILRLDARAGGAWKAVCESSIYGNICSRRFDPVTARQVRLVCEARVLRLDLFPPGT